MVHGRDQTCPEDRSPRCMHPASHFAPPFISSFSFLPLQLTSLLASYLALVTVKVSNPVTSRGQQLASYRVLDKSNSPHPFLFLKEKREIKWQ